MGKMVLQLSLVVILTFTINFNAAPEICADVKYPCNKVLKFWVGRTEFTVDGVKHSMRNAPEIKHGKMYIEFRGPLEWAGGNVSFDSSSNCMGYSYSQMHLQMWVGKNTASVRNMELETTQTMQIDPLNPKVVPYFSKTNAAMVPIRFIAQIFGIATEFDDKDKSFTIKLVSDCTGSACSKILKLWENERVYELDGKKRSFIGSYPERKYGKLFIPVNAILHAIPDDIGESWNDEDKSLWFTWNDNIELMLWVGKNKAQITYRGLLPANVEIDANPSVVPYLKNGEFMAPVDFFAKHIGDGVFYNDSEKSAQLRLKTRCPDPECRWGMYLGNRQGVASFDCTPKNGLSLLWELDLGSSLSSSPVFYEDSVYIVAGNGKIYDVDIKSGKPFKTIAEDANPNSTPCVDKSFFAYLSNDGMLNVFAGKQFEPKNKYRYHIGKSISSPVLHKKRIYIGGEEGLYCIDYLKNKIGWTFKCGQVNSVPVISETDPAGYRNSDNKIVFGAQNGKIYALDLTLGNQAWEFDTKMPANSTCASAIGNVFAGSNAGIVYSLDKFEPTGKKMWEFNAGGKISPNVVYYDNKVIFGTSNGKLYSLSSSSGEQNWVYDAGDPITSPMIVCGNIIYFGSATQLVGVECNTGKSEWRYENKGSLSCPGAYNNRIFFATSDGKLLCFGSR